MNIYPILIDGVFWQNAPEVQPLDPTTLCIFDDRQVCDLVYSELCVHFSIQEECDDFLAVNEIRVEPLSRAAHFAASRAWREYRRQGGPRVRILADFLVGAHAQLQASRLLSRDRGFYRKLFPSLNLIDPIERALPEQE